MFEQAAGELHAKLMIDSHNWTTYNNPGPGRGAGGGGRARAGYETMHRTHQHTRHHWGVGRRRDQTAGLRCRWAAAGPGRTTSRRAELKARSADGERAGRPRGGRRSGGAQNTSGATRTRHTTTRARQRGGYRSTRPFSTHSATASSRLRPNDRQSWRRRRIHRNMPPTTAAPRPATPIRPSKPVRARPFFGLVAGTSGAT